MPKHEPLLTGCVAERLEAARAASGAAAVAEVAGASGVPETVTAAVVPDVAEAHAGRTQDMP